MDFPSSPPTAVTAIGRLYAHLFQRNSSPEARILIIFLLAIAAHLLVQLISLFSEKIISVAQRHRTGLGFVTRRPKFFTIIRLMANTVIWGIYFVAVGLFLEECGINLTAYLASASVIGLGISFGSQGLVQDMVIGLTLIFSDALDVDDMVEIVGSALVVGRVQEIGLRFTKIVNIYNQVVFIPNRTVANVSRFPHGGIYAYADIRFPDGVVHPKTTEMVHAIAYGMWQQFNAIILREPLITARDSRESWPFLRVRFSIWPGQGNLIETVFRQQVFEAMRKLNADYAEWQITVLYRALEEKAPAVLS